MARSFGAAVCVACVIVALVDFELQWSWRHAAGVSAADGFTGDAVLYSNYSLRTKNCPLNACEVLVYITQNYLDTEQQRQHRKKQEQVRPAFGHTSPVDETRQRVSGNVLDVLALERMVESRIRAVERRLRSVEQPVWRLADGSAAEWNRCTEGHCRCLVVTKSLSCWKNGLQSVPPLQTVPMDTLTIDMSLNRLTTLNKETLRGLTHLHVLDLSENELDYLPADVLDDLDGLVKLRLQKNRLEDLHADTFLKLRNLRILDLSHNRLVRLPPQIFNEVRRLSVVNLSKNRLTALPVPLLHELFELEELYMSRNQLEVVGNQTFVNLHSLKTLDLSENNVTSIADGAFVNVNKLQVLNLRENRLTSVSVQLFRNISSLMHLDLSQNRIGSIHPLAFERTVNLVDLMLGQNALQHIPGRLFGRLGRLRKLLVFSNNLTALHNDTFVGLQSLTNLLLNNNILKEMNAAAFKPMQKLEKLRLDSNKLMFMPPGCLDGPNLRAVKLDKNPWHCDCRAIYLARWLRLSMHKLWDGEPTCRGPGDLGGNPVGDLRFADICDGQWASMVSLAARVPVKPYNLADVPSPYRYLQQGFTNVTLNAERKRDEEAERAEQRQETGQSTNGTRPMQMLF